MGHLKKWVGVSLVVGEWIRLKPRDPSLGEEKPEWFGKERYFLVFAQNCYVEKTGYNLMSIAHEERLSIFGVIDDMESYQGRFVIRNVAPAKVKEAHGDEKMTRVLHRVVEFRYKYPNAFECYLKSIVSCRLLSQDWRLRETVYDPVFK